MNNSNRDYIHTIQNAHFQNKRRTMSKESPFHKAILNCKNYLKNIFKTFKNVRNFPKNKQQIDKY